MSTKRSTREVASEKMSYEQLALELEEVKATKEAQAKELEEKTILLATAKITKATSEIFYNKKDKCFMRMSSLSETKRYFENYKLEELKILCSKLKVLHLSSEDFHTCLEIKN